MRVARLSRAGSLLGTSRGGIGSEGGHSYTVARHGARQFRETILLRFFEREEHVRRSQASREGAGCLCSILHVVLRCAALACGMSQGSGGLVLIMSQGKETRGESTNGIDRVQLHKRYDQSFRVRILEMRGTCSTHSRTKDSQREEAQRGGCRRGRWQTRPWHRGMAVANGRYLPCIMERDNCRDTAGSEGVYFKAILFLCTRIPLLLCVVLLM